MDAIEKDLSLHSTFHEQMSEHIFIAEILQEAYFRFGKIVEVHRSEVDATGHDLILECNGVIRHVQLKSSKAKGRTARQNVHSALWSKPNGCAIWLVKSIDQTHRRMRFDYRFFGADVRGKLPPIKRFNMGRHTRPDSTGERRFRPAIRVVPKSAFHKIESMTELVLLLFNRPAPLGLREIAANVEDDVSLPE